MNVYGPGVAAFTARNAALSSCTSWPSWAKSAHTSVKWCLSSSSPDAAGSARALGVVEPAAQRVAGVRRVGDQRVLAEQLHDLRDAARLRVLRVDVEVAGHARPRAGLEADGQAGPRPDLRGRRAARPGMNDARSSESWRIVSVSPSPCRTAPPGARPARAAAPSGPVRRRRPRRAHRRAPTWSRRASRAEAGLCAGGGDELRGTTRGAARRVDLVRVVQLDDLDRLEVAGRLAANRIISTAPIAKFGATSTRPRCWACQPALHRRQPLLVEAGRADDGVDAVLDAELAGCPSPRRAW